MNIFGHLIEFEHPLYLEWSWLPVLCVAALSVAAWLLRRALRDSYADPENLKRTTRLATWFGCLVRAAGWSLATLLLMASLAGPYENNADVTVPEGSLHVVTVFDVSNSMAAEDYRFVLPTQNGGPPIGPWGSRLQMSKLVFTEQVFKAVPGNKIGMVTFTGQGYQQAPLCEDYGTLRFILNHWMGLLSAPGDGSDYVEGLKVAIETLKRDFDPTKKQVILVFSDGGAPSFESDNDRSNWSKDLAGTVTELNALRKEAHGQLRVVVVGMGSRKEQMIPLYDPRTWERVDWFPQGKEEKLKTRLDEAALKQLARATGGEYIWLATDGSASINVDWATALGGSKTIKGKNALDWYPLAGALALVALMLMRGMFRRPDQLPLPTGRQG